MCTCIYVFFLAQRACLKMIIISELIIKFDEQPPSPHIYPARRFPAQIFVMQRAEVFALLVATLSAPCSAIHRLFIFIAGAGKKPPSNTLTYVQCTRPAPYRCVRFLMNTARPALRCSFLIILVCSVWIQEYEFSLPTEENIALHM
jgi:hypothetical protein